MELSGTQEREAEISALPPEVQAEYGRQRKLGRSHVYALRLARATETGTRCAQCGHSGPPQLFEPFNAAGNLACRATTLCQLRQQGTDPAALLGTLLREFAAHDDGKSGQLDTLSTRQLAELNLDLHGPHGEFMGGCAGSVRVYLSSRGDSAQAIADAEAGRLARLRVSLLDLSQATGVACF